MDWTTWTTTVSWATVGGALFIFCLRICDVSMGTVRTILIMRGLKIYATILGFFESLIWVLAISQVITNLDSPIKIVGYSGGFATGTLVGLIIEEKLALGFIRMTIISNNKGSETLKALRDAGYGATSIIARGQKGTVTYIEVIAGRKEAQKLQKIAESVDPRCFITLEEARQIRRGYLPRPQTQLLKK